MKKLNPARKILLLSLILVCQLTAFAQEEIKTEVVKADESACEANSLYLDKLRFNWLSTDLRERIFVIARLGSKEKSRRLNFVRLREVKIFTIGRDSFPKESIIFAEGEKAEGEGRIEIYLGSRLFLVSLAPFNKNVCFACCDDNPPKPKKKR